jgi:DNA-binding response OmpR family regulator
MTLLILDDDLGFAQSLATRLRGEGYQVQTITQGMVTLDALQTYRPDVMLCALWTPLLKQLDFYALLLPQYAALRQRMIFLTPQFLEEPTQAFLTTCRQPWLPKPCELAAVQQAIAQVVHREGV